MKIVDNRVMTKWEFGDIKQGEVFSYDGDIMMKIERIDNGEDVVSAIFVDTGETTFIDDNTLVGRLDCALTIK